MIIERKLKNYTWSFDLDKNELTLVKPYPGIGIGGNVELGHITIDKPRLFSLMRFLVRVSAKLSSRRRIKKLRNK